MDVTWRTIGTLSEILPGPVGSASVLLCKTHGAKWLSNFLALPILITWFAP